MKTFSAFAIVGFAAWLLPFAEHCSGQEPSDRELIEQLRQEVADLRSTLAELTNRLEGHEYQQLPRLETVPPRPPAEATRAAAPLPKHFRFPINIERGTAIPVWSTRNRWWQ